MAAASASPRWPRGPLTAAAASWRRPASWSPSATVSSRSSRPSPTSQVAAPSTASATAWRLIDDGIAAGELGPQDARVRGAAIVGAFLEALVAPLANRAEVPPDRNAVVAEIARFCQAAVGGTEGSPP